MNFKYYYNLFLQGCIGGETLIDDTSLVFVRYPNRASDAAFNYQNMNQILMETQIDRIQCRGYEAYKAGESYIYFEIMTPQIVAQSLEMGSLSSSQNTYGWKLHIRLDDTQDDDNLERGWLIVKSMIINHQIAYSKIIRNDKRNVIPDDPDQLFKTITIYSFRQQKSEQEWQQFIFDVSRALQAAGIRAAPCPDSDRPIKNSEYVSYRNDARNQTLVPDPFKNIDGSIDLRPGCAPGNFCNLR